MKTPRAWLIQWFLENTDVEAATLAANMNSNYFDLGWMDSFRFMEFVSELEKEFNLTFSNDEFQNRDFSTLDGLIRIIESKSGS